MKFTLSWLKDHLDTEASLDTIAETLTRIGLEVEGVEDKAAALKPYVIARILTAEPHPNADRLRVCTVDAGSGELVQVVCGAPNARAGLVSVFAPPGTYVPGKAITLSVGMIRGVESRGMLCSGAELGIGEDHDGILELGPDAPVGRPYAQHAGLDDPVIEINLTPNRPDCASVHGIARDLAAAGLGTLKRGAKPGVRGEGPCPVEVALAFALKEKNLCPLFALRLVRGVRNGRRRPGCRPGCGRSACARSTRWSTSPTTSPSTAAGRCTCSMRPRCPVASRCAAPRPARACWRSTGVPTR